MDNFEDYKVIHNEKSDNDSIDYSGYMHEKQERRMNLKVLSRCGWYLSLVFIAVSFFQMILIVISKNYFVGFYRSDWFELTLTALGMLVVGVPLAYILMRKLPDSITGEAVKLSPKKFIRYFAVCYAVMYYSNLITTIINLIIARLKGSEVVNPIEEIITGSNFWIIIIYASILGPVAEELIFRKFLLDKLRRFGDLPAILITSIAFGLFHMNLSQVLYATAVGMVLAYINVKTNTIRYSIIIHMMLNFIGSGLTLAVFNSGNGIAIGLLSFFICMLVISGSIILIRNYKNIRLVKTEKPLVRKRDYILNVGTIVFIVLCLLIIMDGVIG